MAINVDSVGLKIGPFGNQWDSKDSIIYSLGVGAGVDELEFTTENSQNLAQKVLPTFAVVGAGSSFMDILDQVGSIDYSQLLHADQSIKLYGEIPVESQVETISEVVGVYDKITAASVVIKSTTYDKVSKNTLFENVSTIFIRGEGGFGGPRGERVKAFTLPESNPDHVITYETQASQALIYRLSGDRNPLHSDPTFAESAGFDRPILHGLCTMGFAGRALLHSCCDSDPSRFGAMSVRFVAPVYPGDLLTTTIWQIPDGVIFTTENQSGTIVLDRGRFDFF